jgi:K+-sensing histidine kinase KdpD
LLSLAERAQTIARGITTSGSLKDSVAGLDQPVYSRQEDEIGRLQDNFQQMQRSLATHIGELEQLKTELQARGDRLRSAYNQAQKADRMKTAFLHNMTNQMTRPSETISKDVDALCNGLHCTNPQERERLANEIQRSGHAIADLLNNLIKMSNDEN